MNLLKECLASAGFDVVDASVRSRWNPDEEDYGGIKELVNGLPGEEQRDVASQSKVYVCEICGWRYAESEGDPDSGVAPGTKREDIPEDSHYPVCYAPKESFPEQ